MVRFAAALPFSVAAGLLILLPSTTRSFQATRIRSGVPAVAFRKTATPLFSAPTQENKNEQDSNEQLLSFESSAQSALLGTPVPYPDLTIGILRETFPGEQRVSQSPDSVAALVKAGFQVIVQSGGTLEFVVDCYRKRVTRLLGC